MLEEFYKFTSLHIGGISALIGFLSLLVPTWRKKVESWFRAIQRWAAKDRIEFEATTKSHMVETSGKLDQFVGRYKIDAERWDGGLQKIKEIVGILENGISHKLAILAAQHRQIVEADLHPIFICDEAGNNLLSSMGYLRLIGLSDNDDLSSAQWQMIIYGELKGSYLADFETASANRCTLKSVCDFQNPDTGEHRGRWRVIAKCVEVNNALIFSGRFIPEDEKAHAIADQYGWI